MFTKTAHQVFAKMPKLNFITVMHWFYIASVEFEYEEMTDSIGKGGSDSDHAEYAQTRYYDNIPKALLQAISYVFFYF